MAITLEKRNPVNSVLIVILLMVAGAAGYFYWNSTEASKSRDQMSTRIGFLEEEKARILAEIEKSKLDIENYQKKIESLINETAESKKNQQIAEADLKRKVDEISDLQKRYEKRIQELENEVKQYADFNVLLTKSLEPIREALIHSNTPGASKLSSVPNGGSAAQAPSVFSVASVEKSNPVAELATGQVISIDREFGFVLVNFGSANGVKPGSIVEIYHHNEMLGVGHAERVQDKITAVSIISEDLRSNIQKGDRAVLIS